MGEGDNGGKKGKSCQGTFIKDPRAKPKEGRIESGRWRWVGRGRVVERKWRQMYSNNNNKKKKKKKN